MKQLTGFSHQIFENTDLTQQWIDYQDLQLIITSNPQEDSIISKYFTQSTRSSSPWASNSNPASICN